MAGGQPVDPGGQFGVFFGEAALVVGGETQGHPVVADVDVRMVKGLFGQYAYRGGEPHRLYEVGEDERAGDGLAFQRPPAVLVQKPPPLRRIQQCHTVSYLRRPAWSGRISLVPVKRVGSGSLVFVALRSDQGIVLRGFSFGEADRIIVLITPNHGKLRAVAKGVRKTKSRFGARLEPLTHVDLVLFKGRNLDTITSVSVVEPFPHLRLDLDAVLMAGAMASAVDRAAVEDEPALRLFLLLQRGLSALEQGVRGHDLMTAFLLKLAGVLGLSPALDNCAGCGGSGEMERFSVSGGGMVCGDCAISGAVRLRTGLDRHLSHLAGTRLADLPGDGPLSSDAAGLTRRFMEYHLETPLSSLPVST